MRILCLVTDAFGGHGGISKFNRDLLTSLCSHPGVAEVVAVPRLLPRAPGALPPRLTYVTSGLNGKVSYVLALLRILLRRDRFDLVLCGHINLTPLSFLCRMANGAPLALVVHGIDAWQPTRSRLTNYLVGRIDALVSVSEYTVKRFRAWSPTGKARFYIQPNSVDLRLFAPAPRDPDLVQRYGLGDKVVLMTLGRLDSKARAKGFDEVLEVLPALRREIPNLVYLIAGDGRDRGRLEQKVASLGVEDLVVFTGMVAEDEKAAHYCLADAYVMPSGGEGFGIVLLEAMACGIPTVASKTDGSREALRDGLLGTLVDPGNPREIIEAVKHALKQEPRVPEGLDYFSSTNFQTRVHRLFDAIVQGAR